MQFSKYWMIFKQFHKKCKPFYAVFQKIHFGEIMFIFIFQSKKRHEKKQKPIFSSKTEKS